MNILHGVKMQPERVEPKRDGRNYGFPYSARINPEMAAAVDRIAAKHGVKVSDVVRSAILAFIRLEGETTTVDNAEPVTDRSPPSAPHPAKRDRYRGDGRSDFAATQQVNQRNKTHKGGRLVDKSPVR